MGLYFRQMISEMCIPRSDSEDVEMRHGDKDSWFQEGG